MHLAHPALLLLVLTTPLLFWLWRRRRRPALLYPDVRLLNSLPAGRAIIASRVGAWLRFLALGSLLFALAGPRWPDLRTRIEPEGIAILMAVDVSGSMAEPDFDWQGQPISRLEAVQRAFHLFVAGGTTEGTTFEGRPTDLIGLVTFGTHPECNSPLTLSHGALLRILDAQRPRHVPGEAETNLSDAIALGLARLHAAGSHRKVLVLLTDGEHNVPAPESRWTPRQAAQVAAGLGIPIYTIDAGSDKVAKDENQQQRAAAVQTLDDVARLTKGQSFAAGDTAALLAACREIDRLERAPIQSFQYRRYHEAYPWLGLTAFLCLTLALGLELTVWRRLP